MGLRGSPDFAIATLRPTGHIVPTESDLKHELIKKIMIQLENAGDLLV